MRDTRLDRLDRVDRIARVMDRAFRLPGTSIRLGLDSLIGLVPGVGDTLALAPSAFILSEAYQLGVPRRTLLRMGGNVGIDWVIGLVPLIGDIFDVGWKANSRNAALLRQHVEMTPVAPPAQEQAAKEKAAPGRTRPHHSNA